MDKTEKITIFNIFHKNAEDNKCVVEIYGDEIVIYYKNSFFKSKNNPICSINLVNKEIRFFEKESSNSPWYKGVVVDSFSNLYEFNLDEFELIHE